MSQKIPNGDKDVICPLHKKSMAEVCATCPWWTRIIGKNPQSEELIDDWRCAIALLPMLLIEGAQQTRQAGAAVETLRNELVVGVTEAVNAAANSTIRLTDARGYRRE
jgi:hypothetical protein